MKATLIILLFFIAIKGKCQTPEDNFLFEVTPVLVDTKANFYLSEIAVPFKYSLLNLEFIEAVKNAVPDSVVQSIMAGVQGDSKIFNWSPKQFPKAIIVDNTKVDSLTGNILFVARSGESAKQRKRRKMEFDRRLRGRVYFVSAPVFDNSKAYAIIGSSYSCGNACGEGCYYLFQLVNQHWKIMLKASCWMG